jgi:hypothetical protein
MSRKHREGTQRWEGQFWHGDYNPYSDLRGAPGSDPYYGALGYHDIEEARGAHGENPYGYYGQYRRDSDHPNSPYQRGVEVFSQESQPTDLTTTYRITRPCSRPRGPKGYTRSDERIREDICERLMLRDDIDASDITVTVGQGAVKLTGSVPERYMRYAIEEVVADCSGVVDIDNAVHVERSR